MIAGRLTVTSPASTDAVLAYLADFRHHPAWRHDVIESELESGAAGESGAVYHQRVKQGPSTGDSRVETTVAAGAIAFRTLDHGPVTVSGTYALAERPEGGTVVDCDTTGVRVARDTVGMVPMRVAGGAAAAGLAVLVLAVAAPVSHARPAVFMNGDSLSAGTAPYLPRVLAGWRVRQSYAVSRHAPEAVGILRANGRSLPSVIVMSVGTNDDPRALGAFQRAVSGALAIAGRRRCIVWPTIVRPSVAGATYAGYNRILRRTAARTRRLRVVNWTGLVASHPGWLAGDGVHVNAAGYLARSRAIAQQARACRRYARSRLSG